MPVNIEIKGNLAKLLATENLIIEHKAVDTASFDIDRRVLTLPQWETERHNARRRRNQIVAGRPPPSRWPLSAGPRASG